jgi:hypothetical protein
VGYKPGDTVAVAYAWSCVVVVVAAAAFLLALDEHFLPALGLTALAAAFTMALLWLRRRP